MIQKGTEDYKKAQHIANELTRAAEYDRWNSATLYDLYYELIAKTIDQIIKLNVFASKVAETIVKTLGGHKLARISDKQAWILACAIVENNIEF